MNILSKMGFRTLKKNTRITLATVLAVVFSSLIISLMACVYCLFMYSLSVEKFRQTPIAIFFLIYAFVSVCVVAMLYNSFSISITERIHQLGLLSSIGASPKQIYKSLITESLLIGLIGVPMGGTLGVAVFVLLCRGEAEKNVIKSIGSFLNIENINIQDTVANLQNILMPDLIAIMAILILVVIISAGFAANGFLKMKTIDALGIGKVIKKKGKPIAEKEIRWFDLKKEQFIKKIFGIGGVIGYRSYRRNKKWHRSLQNPLLICITVFAVVNSVMFMLVDNLKSVERDYNMSLSIKENTTDKYNDVNEQRNRYKEYERLVREYCENSKVTQIEKLETNYVYSTSSVLISGNLRDAFLRFVDTETFKKLLSGLDADESSYYNIDAPKALMCNGENIKIDKDCKAELFIRKPSEIEDGNDKTKNNMLDEKYYLRKAIVLGDRISAQKCEFEIIDGAVTLILPDCMLDTINLFGNISFYIYNENSQKSLQADVQAIAEKIYNNYKDKAEIYINKMKLNGIEEHIYSSAKVKGNNITFTITNRDEQYQEAQEIKKGLRFLIPLFSVLVLIVTVANIINAVHHNMIIRRRHFAMYRSIGMDKKQKRQMLIFECVWSSLLSSLLSVPIIFLGIPAAIVFLSYTAAYKLTRNHDDAFFEKIKAIMEMNELWENLFLYMILISIFVLFTFIITTAIADRIIDDGEIIPTLKND